MRTSTKVAIGALFVLALLMIGIVPGIAREKFETIDATAYGTSTQMGANIGVTLIIYDYSTADDRQILVEAYKQGQNQGLVNALSKMKSVGRIAVQGTTGNELSYVKMTPTATGRRIVFVTNRQIRFGEAWADSQSKDFNLTAGELLLDAHDKSKSTGTLFPAAQLVLNKEGELQWELNQNAWRLSGIIDWKGTPGEN